MLSGQWLRQQYSHTGDRRKFLFSETLRHTGLIGTKKAPVGVEPTMADLQSAALGLLATAPKCTFYPVI